jgi:hypothetical protein
MARSTWPVTHYRLIIIRWVELKALFINRAHMEMSSFSRVALGIVPRLAARVLGMRITIAGLRIRMSGLASRRSRCELQENDMLSLPAPAFWPNRHSGTRRNVRSRWCSPSNVSNYVGRLNTSERILTWNVVKHMMN